MPRRADTLLTPGNPEWERLEREKRDLLGPAEDAPVEELLRQGMHLSAEAARLIGAIGSSSGDGPTPSA